ncbi:MAG: type II toxin-antitoxin system VapB family antitoxin [Oscillospiraceae bacterium]|nr:type II toxin-antitoxin system VapB family antitoxin [Oscillospiraceae bacterium]
MQTARIFNNGNSQAIRIPKEYRFNCNEVAIKRIGSALILFQPSERFSVLAESLNEFTPDFLEHGRPTQDFPIEREAFD